MFNFDVVLPQFKQTLTYEERTPGRYEDNGTFTKGDLSIISFQGAVLPLSEQDIKYMPDGDYSIDSEKLYTDQVFKNGTIVRDSSGDRFKVHKFREYNRVNSKFRRYIMERVDTIND